MCPSAPLTPKIDSDADDSQMFMHLESMMYGGPVPENVLSEVNPYTLKPGDLPREMFYFFNSSDARSHERIRAIDVGYWQKNHSCSALTGSSNMRVITMLEFYTGRAPNGDRTVWTMLEYTIDRNSLGSSSLCRIFNRRYQTHPDQHPQAGSDNDDLALALLLSLENEDYNRNVQESSNQSQVLNRNQHALTVCGNDVQNRRTDNFAHLLNRGYDFSRRDFIEYNDLNDSMASSSSSANSRWRSEQGIYVDEFLDMLDTPASPNSNPEDYNAGLSLDDLENPAIPATNQRNSDCRFNVAERQGAQQILVQPAPLGSIATSRNSNTRTNATVVPASMGLDVTLPAPSVVEGRSDSHRRALRLGSATCEANHVDQGPSTSQGARSHGKRKAVGRRIAKFGKKCCCFFPF